MKVLAVAIALAVPAFHVSSKPLPPAVHSEVKARYWHEGCPVPLSDLRLLTVSYWGFDNRMHHGQLVVNQAAVSPLTKVFRQLYKMHFPIRHMRLANMYGPPKGRPKDGDVTGSFSCRAAVPSPCNGNATGVHWSNHAYGLAIDVNPIENPYVSGGLSSHRASGPYLDRSRHRPGTAYEGGVLVEAFRAVGWGWGGSWSGSVRDYQHFSYNGR
jgi:hypothetical protein